MAAKSRGRGLSRRAILQVGAAGGAALYLAACGAPTVVERVVVVPRLVEREVVVERPVFTDRVVVVEKPIIVEREVVVTRFVTPPPTSAARTEPAPDPVKATLRALISPALARAGPPDLGAIGSSADLKLEGLDRGRDSPGRLLARAAAGDLPDLLVGIPGGLVTALDSLDALAPMDTALGGEHGFLVEMLALGRRERGIVGLPVSGHSTYLLASRRRLASAEIAEVGSTYESLGEAARRLTDPETYTYGFGVIAGLPELETVAGSAGALPTDQAAVDAWQWYADQWLRERVSPPPSAWDGQGAAGEAVLDGRVALTVAHGRALSRLAALPPERRSEWEMLPLPSWPEAKRRVPMAAAFIAAGQGDDGTAADAAVALAGVASRFDAGPATPALTLALNDEAARLGLEPDGLLETRDAWRQPIVETPDWHTRATELDVAVHRSLTLGTPASEVLAELQARQAAASSTSS